MAHHTGVNYVVNPEQHYTLWFLLEVAQHQKSASCLLISYPYRLQVQVPVWCNQFIPVQFIITVLAPLQQQQNNSVFCGRMALSPKTSMVIGTVAVGFLLCAC